METYAQPPAAQPVAGQQAAAQDPSPAESVTARLDAKLEALNEASYRILWIEITEQDLVQLLIEGGEQAVLMDPDPDRDVAWYRTHEIRPSKRPGLRIFLEGEHDEMSCHYA
jgi:hypothetical protein